MKNSCILFLLLIGVDVAGITLANAEGLNFTDFSMPSIARTGYGKGGRILRAIISTKGCFAMFMSMLGRIGA